MKNGKPSVVLIGGGSGLSVALRGLKSFDFNLAAIVTMSDDGQSSGRLRDALAIAPPGDIRKCITALAEDEELLTQLFEYRFKRGRGLNGHSLGNLMLAALADITGNFESAISATSKILRIKGKVIPSTLEDVRLAAKLQNGQIVLGEHKIPIGGHKSPIDRIMTIPENVTANPRAVKAINEADFIVIGPGSLYTSVLSNFLIKDINSAMTTTTAKLIYICNVSTERGETEKYSVEDHYRKVKEYITPREIDYVLINKNVVSQQEEGKLGAISNISIDSKQLNGAKVVLKDLVDRDKPLYHNSEKLGKAIAEIIS